MKVLLAIFLVLFYSYAWAQTIGGSATYNFLKLPFNTLLTAQGGVNVSYQPGQASCGSNNPALLEPGLNSQVELAFTQFLAGVKALDADAAWDNQQLKTTFGAHIFFVDYGAIAQTDVAGNVSGSFHPVDYVVQVSGSRQYLEKWHYGFSLKYIHSAYQIFRSSAFALDAGLLYKDSARLLSAALLAKNLGFQIRTFAGAEDMPFDLELGVTKRLAGSPFGFSVTLQQLHQFNILYNDTAFNAANNQQVQGSFINKLFNHVVLSSSIYLGSNLELAIGYNYLRRTELNMGGSGNGLNGFSGGFLARFRKLHVSYALSAYQRNIIYHQLGISLWLNRIFGLGD